MYELVALKFLLDCSLIILPVPEYCSSTGFVIIELITLAMLSFKSDFAATSKRNKDICDKIKKNNE